MAMGFGAGALLSAIAYELIPSASLQKGVGAGIGLALFVGALVYFAADRMIEGGGEMNAGIALFLGTLLDGIPESYIIGVGLALGGSVSVAFVVAVFASNVPEGIAGTQNLRAAGRSRRQVFIMWTALVVASAAAAAVGYAVASRVPVDGKYSQAFAAGAVLTMLADSMMPEAFTRGGRPVGLLTVLGYLVAASVSLA